MKFHQSGPSSLSTLDLNANVNIGRRRRLTGDDISSSVLSTGELKISKTLTTINKISKSWTAINNISKTLTTINKISKTLGPVKSTNVTKFK